MNDADKYGLQSPSETWFEPRFGQILVRPIRRRMSEGGIALPQKAKELLPMCRVVAVSCSRTANNESVDPTVKPGDLVTLKDVHTPLEIGGAIYALAAESAVLGVIHNIDLADFDEGRTRAGYDEDVAAAEAEQQTLAQSRIALASPVAMPRSNGNGRGPRR